MQPCPRIREGPWVKELKESKWRSNGTCSYCGSLSPDLFFQYISNGTEIGPTDKSYKVYVREAVPHHKFYFQHLSEGEQGEFIDLFNDNKINIGYPGHFYVTPFFAKKVVLDNN